MKGGVSSLAVNQNGGSGEEKDGGGDASFSSCDVHAKPLWTAQSPPVCSGLTVKPRSGSVTMSYSKTLSPDALRQ